MQEDKDLEREVERESELHCHISKESKKHLNDEKKRLNWPLGKIVDRIIRKEKSRRAK